MTNFLGSIWWLIVSIGILVTFHEFGHFWVARRFGVHVLRFSVGFGKPLLKHVGRDGTEFVVSAIPLGGYVKFLDEGEFIVDPTDLHRAYNRRPVWQRMTIAAAGPAANFLLCFLLLWTMFVVGRPDYLPIVGRAENLAAQAGFLPGDRILSIDGENVGTWTDAAMQLAVAAVYRRTAQVAVVHSDGGQAIRTIDMRRLRPGIDDSETLGQIGLVEKQFMVPPVIDTISPDGPRRELQVGDRILSVDGLAVGDFVQLDARIREQARVGKPLHLAIQRGNVVLQVDVLPRVRDNHDGSKARLTLGIGVADRQPAYDGLRRYSPIGAIGESASEMRRQTEATFVLVRDMFVHGSTQGLSGPVGIAQVANASAKLGVAWFLFFLAILSLSLGLVNLLPVPILDGGHLLYYLIELVKGSPVSERSQALGQYVGLALLGGLMCVAFYNDLLRQLS